MKGFVRTGWSARARVSILALAIAGTAGSAIALAPLGPFAGSACAGAGPYHAAVVVTHLDGTTIQRCVAFSDATITGYDLLQKSGIEFETQQFGSFGQAVCEVDNEPPTWSTCLPPSPEPYWVIFVARGGGPWTPSKLGISTQSFADGDAEGFRYDSQDAAAAPPSAPTPCPSATPVPTATPRPTAAATPRPTSTPKPPSAATPRPTAGVTSQPTPTTSPTLSPGPTTSLPPPSPVASEPVPVASGTSPAAEPADASQSGALATAGTVLALLVMLVVVGAAARSRSRRADR